jgi:hypothetical protein
MIKQDFPKEFGHELDSGLPESTLSAKTDYLRTGYRQDSMPILPTSLCHPKGTRTNQYFSRYSTRKDTSFSLT